MGERAPTAYMFRERLYETFYGEVHRALDPGGTEVRILQISEHLSQQPGLADAVALYGSNLGGLEGDHVVHTRTVDTSEPERARVVTDAVRDPACVLEILGGLPAKNELATEVALALASGMLEGLASAHQMDIVHGGLHPRSLFVDKEGVVKLGDFAVARAVAEAAEQSEDPELGDAFRGFEAPELAMGGEPDKAADVYAAGALVFCMLSGEALGGPQAERLTASTSVRRTVMRALDAEPERRFANAVEFKDAFHEAIVSDACSLASRQDLAEHASDALTSADLDAGFQIRDYDADPDGGSDLFHAAQPATYLDNVSETLPGAVRDDAPLGDDDDDLDLGDDDLDLGDDDDLDLGDDDALDLGDDDEDSPLDDDAYTEVEPDNRHVMGSDPLGARVDNVLSALEGRDGPGEDPLEGALPRAESEDDEGDDSLLTQVDDVFMGIDQRDPISEILALDKDDFPTSPRRVDSSDSDENTPLPAPMAAHDTPGSVTREAQDILKGTGRSKPVFTRATDAVEELVEEQEREDSVEEEALGDQSDLTEAVSPVERARSALPSARRIPAYVWIAATGLALLVLFVILWTQTDVFHPERARAKKEALDRKQRAELRRLKAEQKSGGNIVIASNVEGAAVWLLLGRTPLDSMPLPNYHVHQLRFQRDGYKLREVMVKAPHWTGDRAVVHRKLMPGSSVDPVPAWPPRVPSEANHGFAEEQRLGVIHVESAPPGAEVWLLVGFTPDIRMSDFERGVKYEFKVLKDGYRPGFVQIQPNDWFLDPGDPTSLRAAVGKGATLERLEPPGAGNSP